MITTEYMLPSVDSAAEASAIESSWEEFDRFVASHSLVANWLESISCDVVSLKLQAPFDESEFADIEGMIAEREQSEEGVESMRHARRWVKGALYKNENTTIRSFRLERGMSQRALADAIGTNQATISRWEKGRGNLEASSIVRLATVLEVPSVRIWEIAEAMLVRGEKNG